LGITPSERVSPLPSATATRPVALKGVRRGAGEFAALLGKELRWPVFDRVIGEHAAAQLGVEPDRVAPMDEDSYLERLEKALSLAPQEVIDHAPARTRTEQVPG
jgi:hypothetical protein